MYKCILCENTGKNRKFFSENMPLCDSDYIDYLELLITEMNEVVAPESLSKALSISRISRRPESASSYSKQFTTRRRRR